MRKLFTIGIDVAIMALIVGTLFSGQPMWTKAQASTANSMHAVLTVAK